MSKYLDLDRLEYTDKVAEIDDDIAEVFGRRGAKADFEGESSMLIRRMMERGERDNISLGIMYLY